MHRFTRYLLVYLLLFIALPGTALGEGTKQIYPEGWGNYMFCISHDPIRNQFALYNCPKTERLNIQIYNTGEIIYYGLNAGGNTSGFYYRIRDPKDNIVVPQTQIPTSGPGFINDLNEARIGPNTLFTGGYTPLSYVATDTGTYYIEFSFSGFETTFNYLDITVANPAGTAEIPGRLWSKGWQLSSTNGDQMYGAKMYVYTDDQICTSIDFHGQRPYTFDISCNQTGCAQTGNFVEDRKSRTGRHLYPQYKIFLNEPDSIAFPTGVLGQIDSVNYTADCNGSITFQVWVNKSGAAEVLLDIYPPIGNSAGDVTLPTSVLPGSAGNIILWNGLDGYGQQVPNGAKINVVVSYLNGLTHLPIYDVEWNWSYTPWWTGYVVQLVRPPGGQPQLFWNDSLCGGGANLTGCVDPNGCHTWDFTVGDVNTINTWWYAASISLSPIIIVKKQNMDYDSMMVICQGDSILVNGAYIKTAGNYLAFDTSRVTGCDSNVVIHLTVNPRPAANLGPDTWICAGQTHQFDAGPGAGYSYRWDNLTTGAMNIATTQTYTTGVQGFYRVRITNPYLCTNSDSVNLFVNAKPNVTNNPMRDTICSSTNFVLNLTSSVSGATFNWVPAIVSGNITGASPGSGTTISQTLINTMPSSSVLQYTITPFSGGCYGNDTIYTVVVKPKPMVTATPLAYTLCSPGTTGIQLTSQVASPLFGWKATASSGNVTGYSNGTGPVIQQLLTNSGPNPETVIYRVAASANGCTGDSVTFTVTLMPLPNLTNSPLSQGQCNNINTSILLTSNVTGALFTWTATPGSPNITGQSDQPIPSSQVSQVLINSSFTDQTVTYHITPHANGCSGPVVDFLVTVHPSPDLSNTLLFQGQCNNTNTSLVLTSQVSGTLFTWTATGSSLHVTGYSGNSTPALQISQTLVNAGFNVETVTYSITPVANNCIGQICPYVVTVYPTPNLQVTPTAQTLCSGDVTGIALHSDVTGTTFTWTAAGSSPDVSGYADGSGNLIQQTLVNSGYLAPSVTFQVTPTANACSGPAGNAFVTVNPRPAVSFSVCFDTITTINARPIRLKGGVPPGGTYSGPGVNPATGIFTPLSAGTGTKTIVYSYSNVALCSTGTTRSIVVLPVPAFTCGNSLTDIRDSKVYPTIQIGFQCWMAADLDYGTEILQTVHQQDNCVPEKYSLHPSPLTVHSYYQWDELMLYDNTPGLQGFCPPGWHVPTEGDWNILFSVYINNGFAGSPLKYSGYSGFNALLSGARHHTVAWDFQDFAAFFWSSTAHGPLKAWAHGMNDFDPSVSLYPSLRSNAFSVRCLKD